MMSLSEILLVVSLAPVALAALAFWIWMLVDCLKYEGKADLDRLLWAVVIIALKLLGAVIYYFVRYRKRRPLPQPV